MVESPAVVKGGVDTKVMTTKTASGKDASGSQKSPKERKKGKPKPRASKHTHKTTQKGPPPSSFINTQFTLVSSHTHLSYSFFSNSKVFFLFFFLIAGVPWTAEEHKRFLLGLSALGKGDWRGISRHYVQTRTPTQVASHAQKYFIRQTSTGNKRKRRTSLFDTTLDSIPEANGDSTVINISPSSGSLEGGEDTQQPSVSPSNSTEGHVAVAKNGNLPIGIMPVGILAKSQDDLQNFKMGVRDFSNFAASGSPRLQAAAAADTPFAASNMHPGFPAGGLPFGMLPPFPGADPSTLAAFFTSMMMMGKFNPLLGGVTPMPNGRAPTATATSSLAAAQIFRPMAVRYTNMEVQKFKKEWNGSLTSLPNGKEENKLRTHIRKVYKQTKGKEQEKSKVPTSSGTDLTSNSSSSLQTTILIDNKK